MPLLFFDFGAGEIFLLLVVALILFGPRKLPELSRTIGKSLGEFKRASDEFKRTWVREVSVETTDLQSKADVALVADQSIAAATVERDRSMQSASGAHASPPAETSGASALPVTEPAQPDAPVAAMPAAIPEPAGDAPAPQMTRKRDWL